MGILTVATCGISTALICDRLATIIDLFNPNQTASGLNHFLIRPPEIITLALLSVIALIFFVAAYKNTYPYNLSEMQYSDLQSIYNFGTSKKQRGKRELGFSAVNNCTSLARQNDLDRIEHFLIGIASIDTEECFLRRICQINQKKLQNDPIPLQHENLLELIKNQGKKMANSVYWDVYKEALNDEEQDCRARYKLCKP